MISFVLDVIIGPILELCTVYKGKPGQWLKGVLYDLLFIAFASLFYLNIGRGRVLPIVAGAIGMAVFLILGLRHHDRCFQEYLDNK